MEMIIENISQKMDEEREPALLPEELITVSVRLRKSLEGIENLREKHAMGTYSRIVWAIRDIDRKIFQATGLITTELLERKDRKYFFSFT